MPLDWARKETIVNYLKDEYAKLLDAKDKVRIIIHIFINL